MEQQHPERVSRQLGFGADFTAAELSAGQFGFGITGLPNLAVDIESSGDLAQWQVIGTYVLQGGTNYFASPTPPQGLQFYRSHVH
jgi:hypothetical protein